MHGRVLVREARAAAARGIVIGFHGYMENARTQMERLEAIPGAALWMLVAVQALHRFYRGRSEEVVASWMTSEDRDAAIADNIEYVDAALDSVPHDGATRIVYAGFRRVSPWRSDGGPRQARRGGRDWNRRRYPARVLADPEAEFPYVLLARGARDEWLTANKFRADLNALTGARPRRGSAPLEYDGGHEWGAPVAEGIGDFLDAV